jgi:hypothetical protein
MRFCVLAGLDGARFGANMSVSAYRLVNSSSQIPTLEIYVLLFPGQLVFSPFVVFCPVAFQVF